MSKEISEDDWKVVEARLQQDIDNGKGEEVGMMFIGGEGASNNKNE